MPSAIRRYLRTAALLVLGACTDGGDGGGGGTGPVTTDLSITVTGLPAGATSLGRLIGPGVDRAITGPTTVEDLAAGTYFLRAQPIAGAAPAWPVIAEDTIVLPGRTTAQLRYSQLPVAGSAVSRLLPFDAAMLDFMVPRGIRAGVLAVSRGDAVVYRRAFGWSDAARTVPLAPEAAFRVASLTKPMTMALIHQLVAEGKLQYTTPVYEYLGFTTLADRPVDARAAQITVRHLLDHQTGWQVPPGWLPDYRTIARLAGRAGPPTREDVGRWTMGLPFGADPGTTQNYSNLGYLLLGLVVEKAAAQELLAAMHDRLLPAEHRAGVLLAASRPADRDPREPAYLDAGSGCSVFDADTCVLVPMPDGGFHVEGFTSYGGVVATTDAYLAFMRRFRPNGLEGTIPSGSASWFGAIHGTFTLALWRGDGTRVVAFFNQRSDPSGLPYNAINQTMNAAAAAVDWSAP